MNDIDLYNMLRGESVCKYLIIIMIILLLLYHLICSKNTIIKKKRTKTVKNPG
jgi:hypothetical protein